MTAIQKSTSRKIDWGVATQRLLLGALAVVIAIGVFLALTSEQAGETLVPAEVGQPMDDIPTYNLGTVSDEAPFGAGTGTPTHTGRKQDTGESGEFLSGTENPTHTGRRSP